LVPCPAQWIVDFVDRMIGDAGQEDLGLKAIEDGGWVMVSMTAAL
jgi:hypothetical protein